MVDMGRDGSSDSGIQEDPDRICLSGRLSTLMLKHAETDYSSECIMDMEDLASHQSEADSCDIVGVGSKFDDLARLSQYPALDDDVYGPSPKSHPKRQLYSLQTLPGSGCSVIARPLFSWTSNPEPDIIDLHSERATSLTTARTAVSEGSESGLGADTILREHSASEDLNVSTTRLASPNLTPPTLETIQSPSTADELTEPVSLCHGSFEQDFHSTEKSIPEAACQFEGGDEPQEKKGTVSVSGRRGGGTTSSHQGKSSLPSRKRKGGGSPEDHDDENGQNGDQGSDGVRRSKTAKEGSSQRQWACPYAKQNPWKHHKCLDADLAKISYVKQHLYRNHGPGVYCRRCGKQFSELQDLQAHQTEMCQSRNIAFAGKMTHEQENKVKEIKSRDVTDEERWFQIFEIVCRGAARPASPYAQPAPIEVLESFRNDLRREIGQQAVRMAASSLVPHVHSEIYTQLVEQTVSNFIQRLGEPDEGTNVVGQNSDHNSVLAANRETVFQPELEHPPVPAFSEWSSASTVGAVGSLSSARWASSSGSTTDFRATNGGHFTHPPIYNFTAGVQGNDATLQYFTEDPGPWVPLRIRPRPSYQTSYEDPNIIVDFDLHDDTASPQEGVIGLDDENIGLYNFIHPKLDHNQEGLQYDLYIDPERTEEAGERTTGDQQTHQRS